MITQIQQSLYIFRLVEELVLYTAEGKYPFGPICLKSLFVDAEHIAHFLVVQPVFHTEVLYRSANVCHPFLKFAEADTQLFKSLFVNTYKFHILFCFIIPPGFSVLPAYVSPSG